MHLAVFYLPQTGDLSGDAVQLNFPRLLNAPLAHVWAYFLATAI